MFDYLFDMRKLSYSIIASAVLLISNSYSKAEDLNYNFWGLTSREIPGIPTFEETTLLDGFERGGAYIYNSDTGSILQISDQEPLSKASNEHWQIDPATKKLWIPSNSNGGGRAGSYFHVLDPVTKTWSKACEGDDTFDWARVCDVRIPDGGITVNTSANTSVSVGDPNDPTVISSSGISGIITHNSSTGITSLGANSLKLQETSTQQKMWGTNASGESVPINITNGSKLLINGRDVDQAIDNVGALSAALTGLPTVPQDSPLACGVGAGAHSGSNALSGGCASKINERLSFNAAASFIPANQEYQGTDNSWSGRAGFVFKLGKINNPTLISMKEKKVLQSKVNDLAMSNKNIKEENQELKELLAMQSQKLTLQNERLEKLEQIALGNFNSKELVSSLE